MAEKKVIEIDVKTEGAVKAMNNLSKATHDVSQSFEEVYGDLQPLTTRMGEAEDRLYELANAGKTTTQEYKDLLKTVSDYRKVQIQTDMAVDASATTMGQKLGGAIGGVTSGFSVAQGAMGAFGAESEALEKSLLKVQSALAIQQGFAGIKESIPSFNALKTSAVSAFQSMTTAGKAFAVTGIGLLITAVGVLIANWDEWFGQNEKVVAQQKRIAEQAKEQRQHIAEESGEFATLISRLKNTNQGSKERADLIKKINGQYGTTLKNIKDEAKFQESLNKELASYLEYQKAKYTLQKNEELITKNLEKQDEIQSKINKAKKELPNLLKEQQKWQKELDKTSATDTNMVAFYAEKTREAKDAVVDQRKEISKLEIELAKAEKRFNAYGAAANNASAKVDSITNNGTKYVEQNDKPTSQVKAEDAKKEVEVYETLEIKKAEIQKTSNLTLQGHIDERLQAQQKAAELELQILDAKATKAALIDERSHSKKVELAKSGLEAIAQITEIFGKKSERAAKQAFKVQKAANIASALITTYQNATSAYASQFTPLPDPSSPVRGGIAAGIAIATGLANVAKISQQKFEGGGSTSSNTPSNNMGGSVPQAPSFNVVGNSGLNQLAQLQQQPTKAYVVSGDVTTAQALDRNRIENATLVK